MLEFICYPKCATCLKAQKWLDCKGIPYRLRNIKEDNPSLSELEKWSSLSSLPVKKLFNTSGLLYKSLALKDKLPEMTEAQMLSLLSTDGMLVKRPLIVGDSFLLVGFKEAAWEEQLG